VTLIASIPKNSREEIHVSRDEYNGHDLINLRVFYDVGEGDMRPGKQGVAVKATLLPDVLNALQNASELEATNG
jgi:hypothetical protein